MWTNTESSTSIHSRTTVAFAVVFGSLFSISCAPSSDARTTRPGAGAGQAGAQTVQVDSGDENGGDDKTAGGSAAGATAGNMKMDRFSAALNPLTSADAEQAEPGFWLNQPASFSVPADDFDTLWEAAERVSRDLLFTIDRRDRRSGVLTTLPTISAQWFEPWRRELRTAGDLAESSLATVRRTIVWQINDDTERTGGFVIQPKVVVERQAITDRRVSGLLTRQYFRRDRETTGSREADLGQPTPDSYWYATGRDTALEKYLANQVKKNIAAR